MTYSTKVLPVRDEADTATVELAASILREGGLVVIPTETVYGLAANALDERAVARIFEVKGRPQDNPLIVHIADIGELDSLASEIPDAALKLARRFWPGPLTMVLPRGNAVPDIVAAGLDSVAVRMPSHPVANRLIRRSGLPLAAPSANLSGRPSPTTAAHCLEDLNGRVPLILDGGPCSLGVESTVVSLTDGVARVLRPGAVTPAQIESELGAVTVDPAVYAQADPKLPAPSPGMRHAHYAPKARVTVLAGEWEDCRGLFMERRGEGVWGLVFDEELDSCPVPAISLGPREDAQAHARVLFSRLRELDEKGARHVLARAPREEGVGLAVYNRLIRAAGFAVINV